MTPVLSQGTDTAACTTNVFVSTQDELYVTRSPTGANPTSICVTKGDRSQRFTVGTTGEADPPEISWTVDS